MFKSTSEESGGVNEKKQHRSSGGGDKNKINLVYSRRYSDSGKSVNFILFLFFSHFFYVRFGFDNFTGGGGEWRFP